MQANTSDINRSREREDRRKQALGLVEYLLVAAKAAGNNEAQEAYLTAFRAIHSVRERTFADLGRDRELERESIMGEKRRMKAARDTNEPEDSVCH